METIGALKNSNSNSAIYFCTLTRKEYEQQTDLREQLSNLAATSDRYNEFCAENVIVECFAFESDDEMQCDKKMVGVVFKVKKKDRDIYYAVCYYDYLDIDPFLYDVLDIQFDEFD